MGFFKSMFGSVTRDLKIRQLKAAFARDFPGEKMNGTLEGYCGVGMMVAQSINDGTQDRIRFLNVFEEGLRQEDERHRHFAKEAYDLGVETYLEK
ncbi:hypothetical protein [Pseudoduganella violaceinigra]|uniref:hypothetical protein n=1 Tax=Pseudoduganella violaceinigra TaxID=246602 RepID=UPI000489889D|nr:hypothetical protein [Pseudoduganella violaceinigra]